MANELTLQTGPYRTTFIGTEIVRESTKDEWENYGEILRRVDEAKQWAIGDWLVDGKRHYGDGVYEKAAKVLGCSAGDLRNMKYIAEQFELSVRTDKLSWRHHYEVASIKLIEEDEEGKLFLSDKPDTDKIQSFLKEAENLSVRELRGVVKTYKEEQREYIRLANEPEKYPIIYADPPWKYDSGEQHTWEEQETTLSSHYESKSFDEICAMPIKQIATQDSILYLWVPAPMIYDAEQVVKAWGFEYKNHMVWDKDSHNVGHYISAQHECLLICIRGIPPRPTRLADSVYTEKRTEHSKKPEYFRKLIDELYPHGKRIELFARGALPKHWDGWGNELQK